MQQVPVSKASRELNPLFGVCLHHMQNRWAVQYRMTDSISESRLYL